MARGVVERFDVYLVTLDPTLDHEMRKSRPCVIISPDEMNRATQTVIIAPMTTRGRSYPTRVASRFGGVDGQVALDQLRSVDKRRLVTYLGQLDPATYPPLFAALAALFAP